MDSTLIKMIVENFMYVMPEYNRFVGVKKECYGMKKRLVLVCRTRHYVLVIGKNGLEMKVGSV
jgi:hypothetical protein